MNEYQRAITILMEVSEGKQDAVSLVFKLARDFPNVLCQLVEPNVMQAKVREVMAFLNANNKVGAIKIVREVGKIGLKEAKDIVDAAYGHPPEVIEKTLMEQLSTMHRSVPPPPNWIEDYMKTKENDMPF